MKDVADLLADSVEGRSGATRLLATAVYDHLHAVAAGLMRRESPGHLLQPTALINEAYLRLVGHARTDYASRVHFIATAVTEMKRVLIDHARREKARKRGGGWLRVTLTDGVGNPTRDTADLMDLGDTLTRLEALNPRHCRVFELRFFGGLTVAETAAQLGVSEGTVKNDWRFATAWLAGELGLTEPEAE